MIARRAYAEIFAIAHGEAAVPLLLACLGFLLAMYAAVALYPMGMLAALGIALLPALLATAWSHPFLFPYGAYALLVPFDLLLSVPELGTLARLCGALAGAALLCWLLRNRQIVLPGAATYAWLALVLWSWVSLLWTIQPAGALHESGTFLQLVSLYVIVAICPARLRDVRIVFAAVVVGGLAAAAFGIRELSHPTAAQQLLTQISDRIPLVIGNQSLDINEFADALLLPMALVIVATARARSFTLGLCGFGAICLLVYAMSLAASREAFVAVALMLLYFFVALRERWAIAAATGGLAVIALANGNVLHRFLSAISSDGSGRLGIWNAGLAAFREHWLVGAGSGSFAAAYDRVYLQVFQRYDMGWSRAAHDMLLQNGVEYGVVGLALLVLAVVLTFRSIPAVRAEHPLFAMRTAVYGALLALCVAGFFVDLTTVKVFWLALSLAALLRACAATGAPGVLRSGAR